MRRSDGRCGARWPWWPVVAAFTMQLAACGGPGDGPERTQDATVSSGTDRKADPASGLERRAALGSERAEAANEPRVESSAAPRVTEVPDACELLTRADAAELLGAPVGSGRSADILGLGNCAYRAGTGEQLSLVVQLGRDDSVENTQFAMSFEHCGTRAVARPDELGRTSALLERPAEPCGRGFTLWVATGLGFQGRTHPDLVRPVRGKIHLTLSRDPAADAASALPALRQAADRVLARLGRRPRGATTRYGREPRQLPEAYREAIVERRDRNPHPGDPHGRSRRPLRRAHTVDRR